MEKVTRFRIVSNNAEKNAALEEARRDGFMWVASARVPLKATMDSEFILGCYRMRFERKHGNGRGN